MAKVVTAVIIINVCLQIWGIKKILHELKELFCFLHASLSDRRQRPLNLIEEFLGELRARRERGQHVQRPTPSQRMDTAHDSETRITLSPGRGHGDDSALDQPEQLEGQAVKAMDEENAEDSVSQDDETVNENKRERVMEEVEMLVKRDLQYLRNDNAPKFEVENLHYQPHHLNVDAMLEKVRVWCVQKHRSLSFVSLQMPVKPALLKGDSQR
jgi:hypothetical protein